MKQKRVAAIHDISGFGKCSLTVALPVISAAGIECCVIPTAVLSTHTGGFEGYTYRDLTDDIMPFAEHWHSLDIGFDAIYTGFLGSTKQTGIVRDIVGLLKDSSARASQNAMLIVDPAMADFGKLYSTFSDDFPSSMRALCEEADVLIPNLTEASLLCETAYSEGPFEEEEVRRLVKAVAGIMKSPSGRVILTGVSMADNPHMIGAASYEKAGGKFDYTALPRVEPSYHGTGDVFASVLCAALVSGRSLFSSSEIAVRFTVEAIKRSKAAGTDNRYGVMFEPGLAGLSDMLLGS